MNIELNDVQVNILSDLLVEWIQWNNTGDHETLSKRQAYIKIYRQLGGIMKFEEYVMR